MITYLLNHIIFEQCIDIISVKTRRNFTKINNLVKVGDVYRKIIVYEDNGYVFNNCLVTDVDETGFYIVYVDTDWVTKEFSISIACDITIVR